MPVAGISAISGFSRVARLLLALSGAVAATQAQARSAGITGYSGNPAVNGGSTCATCHTGSTYLYNAPSIAGTTTATASSANSFTLNVTKSGGASAAKAGFNLSTTGGTLVDPNSGDSSVRKVGSELTHGTPRLPVAGNFSWNFSWTAPATAGTYTFYVCISPVNDNNASTGDGTIQCGSTTITVNVAPVAPMAANDNYSTPQNTSLTMGAPGVLGNDTDANGDSLNASVLSNPSSGTLLLDAAGGFSYTPNMGFTGSDSFTYRASDGSLNSNTATVTITVGVVNAAPVAANDSYSTAQDSTLIIPAPGVLGNDSDADGNPLSAMSVTVPANGTLSLNPDGAFTYTPDAGFSGLDSFTYQVNDGKADSNMATVSLTVTLTAVPGAGRVGGGAPAPLLLSLFALAVFWKRNR